MKYLKRLLVMMGVLATLLVASSVSPPTAGAQSVLPCPGGSNGWFWVSDDSMVNCSIQGNHIVMDLHYAGGVSVGAYEAWHPWNCYPQFDYSGSRLWLRFRSLTVVEGCNFNVHHRFYAGMGTYFEGDGFEGGPTTYYREMWFGKSTAANCVKPVEAPGLFIFRPRGIYGNGPAVKMNWGSMGARAQGGPCLNENGHFSTHIERV